METTLNNTMYRATELVLLFVALPLILAFNPIIPLSLLLALAALIYVLVVSKHLWGDGSWRVFFRKKVLTTLRRLFKRDLAAVANNRAEQGRIKEKRLHALLRIAAMIGVFMLSTSIFVYLTMPNEFFHVMLNNTLLWLAISIFYSVFSVLPQEFLYRSFFFKRYQCLIPNKMAFILVNAIIFCLAHVMFFNQLVLILTFCGGLIFAYTYQQTRSFWIVSVEHILYGVWLYTLGMGAMLAFPSG
ncbi:CPBP family intramembrane glutamic endopeptidase [Agaribacter marinus]|uniref:CPBP family intramembrane glutamic endopeptidase n=1 Tax=Agaribacter marinus TaxID=1431249 RepID=UPI0024E0C66B|nr:CPBP family intramembrane metalloprotease [Agaribacter marinus]